MAHKIMHSIKWKTQGKKGVAALKLDMSKTYNHMEWDFFKEVMVRIGFCSGMDLTY